MKVTPAFGPMSGKMGGTVASRNRGGAYFRAKVIPTNPNTTRQQSVRSYMTAAVNSWIQDLSDPQRQGWKDYAANTPYTDTLGQTITMTGQNAYIGSYVARAVAGLPVVEGAPILFDTGQPAVAIIGDETTSPTPDSISLDSGDFADTVIELMSPADDDGDVILQIGPPVNPTVNFWKGPYQFGLTIPIAAAATSVTIPGISPTIDTPLAIGQFRPIRIRIAYDDGRVSSPMEVIVQVIEVST